jgi:hypothetical protein
VLHGLLAPCRCVPSCPLHERIAPCTDRRPHQLVWTCPLTCLNRLSTRATACIQATPGLLAVRLSKLCECDAFAPLHDKSSPTMDIVAAAVVCHYLFAERRPACCKPVRKPVIALRQNSAL